MRCIFMKHIFYVVSDNLSSFFNRIFILKNNTWAGFFKKTEWNQQPNKLEFIKSQNQTFKNKVINKCVSLF